MEVDTAFIVREFGREYADYVFQHRHIHHLFLDIPTKKEIFINNQAIKKLDSVKEQK